MKLKQHMRFVSLSLSLLSVAPLGWSQGHGNPCSVAPPTGQRDPCVIDHQTRLNTIETTTIPGVRTYVRTEVNTLGTTVNENKKTQDQNKKTQDQKISELQDSVKNVGFNADRFWVLLAAVLVFFMQAGFKCLEVGMVQKRFDAVQAAQKMFSWIMTFVGYFPIGFGIMFGATSGGFFGVHPWGPKEIVDAATTLIANVTTVLTEGSPGPTVRGTEFFLFQAAFAATAVTIPAGALAERISLKAYMWAALFIATIVYPVFGHWAWGGSTYTTCTTCTNSPVPCLNDNSECKKKLDAVLKNPSNFTDRIVASAKSVQAEIQSHKPLQGWLQDQGFHDFAGSTVVHSVGGWFALVGALFLGPRRGRFNKDGSVDINRFPSRSRGYAVLGVFMLWFGWWGFNGGSLLSFDFKVADIILNTNLAGAAAGLSAYLFAYLEEWLPSRWFQKGFVVEKTIGGALGGLVAITASCDLVSPVQAFFIVGALAGITHNLVFNLLLWCQVDDPVGAFPVHTGCGILGTLLVSITYAHPLQQLTIQLRGVLTAFVWTVLAAGVFFSALWLLSRLPAVGSLFQLQPPETEWISPEDAVEAV
jgi:Amt family ammonium transporter